MKATLRSLLFLVCGTVLGALLVLKFPVHAQAPAAAQSDAQTQPMDLAALTASAARVNDFETHASRVY